MKRWEYTTWNDGDCPLDEMGANGWEAVGCTFAMTSTGSGAYLAAVLFKRPLPEPYSTTPPDPSG